MTVVRKQGNHRRLINDRNASFLDTYFIGYYRSPPRGAMTVIGSHSRQITEVEGQTS